MEGFRRVHGASTANGERDLRDHLKRFKVVPND